MRIDPWPNTSPAPAQSVTTTSALLSLSHLNQPRRSPLTDREYLFQSFSRHGRPLVKSANALNAFRHNLGRSELYADSSCTNLPNEFVTFVAIGQKCAASMEAMGMDCHVVRHPANGGATAFREQALALFRRKKSGVG